MWIYILSEFWELTKSYVTVLFPLWHTDWITLEGNLWFGLFFGLNEIMLIGIYAKFLAFAEWTAGCFVGKWWIGGKDSAFNLN